MVCYKINMYFSSYNKSQQDALFLKFILVKRFLMMDSKCLKHVVFFTKIKLRNSLSCWLLLQEYITMHGPVNVKCISVFITGV